MQSSSIPIPIIGEISPGQINTHYSTNLVLRFRNATQYLACCQYYVPCGKHKPIKHDKTQNQKAEGLKVPRLNKFILTEKSVTFRVDLIKCSSHYCSTHNSAHIIHSNKMHGMKHHHHTDR